VISGARCRRLRAGADRRHGAACGRNTTPSAVTRPSHSSARSGDVPDLYPHRIRPDPAQTRLTDPGQFLGGCLRPTRSAVRIPPRRRSSASLQQLLRRMMMHLALDLDHPDRQQRRLPAQTAAAIARISSRPTSARTRIQHDAGAATGRACVGLRLDACAQGTRRGIRSVLVDVANFVLTFKDSSPESATPGRRNPCRRPARPWAPDCGRSCRERC
jgi:hypothetical protein